MTKNGDIDLNSTEPIVYPREALDYAFQVAKKEGVSLRPVLEEIGGHDYYMKIYGKRRRSTGGVVSESELTPIFERVPIFKQYVEEGAARWNKIKEDSVSSVIAQTQRRLQLISIEIIAISEQLEKAKSKIGEDSIDF